jgi:hypothetical protein
MNTRFPFPLYHNSSSVDMHKSTVPHLADRTPRSILVDSIGNTTSPGYRTGIRHPNVELSSAYWRSPVYIVLFSRRVIAHQVDIVRMSRIGSLSSALRTSRASGSTIYRRFASTSTNSPTLRNRWVTLASIGVCSSPSHSQRFNGIDREANIRPLESSHTPSFDLLYYSMNSLRNRNRKPRLLR